MVIKNELQHLWGAKATWQLIPLGKGYYTMMFHNAEDKLQAKSKPIWEIFGGHVRLREWTKNFDPFKEHSSLANVWVRIHYLPIEYWNVEILAGIGRFVGHPLKIDGASVRRDFGQYARLYIEIDLAKSLPTTLLIDVNDISFHVEFSYEYIPLYCSSCKVTGHSLDKCRKGKHAGAGDMENFTDSPLAHKSSSISPRSGEYLGRQNHVDLAYFNSQNSSRQTVSLGSRSLSPRAGVAQNSLGRKNENNNIPSQVREEACFSDVVVEARLGLMLENPREISPKRDHVVAAL
ncbi:uncharacterized protein LOC131025708 [Salvia miltiorrhiza]|uniref:uncharacterized protein LOC131025708 n=1 Tax=Salvia miltiorrhiza TaxID=226208 RepID=UPI0025AC293C|nr:uncharacterized protein LOC131025708 [Salvia miltiorrhiza]